MTVSVMFVCLGNICRSPTAHGVFESLVKEFGLQDQIVVESSGTGGWHIGESPDKRATVFAATRGFDLADLRAQQFKASDFDCFDYILAMDKQNLRDLEMLRPEGYRGVLDLFLSFSAMKDDEVPDPYYGGDAGFEHVLDLVESASKGLLAHIQEQAS
mgnify:CR=1 FL=1